MSSALQMRPPALEVRPVERFAPLDAHHRLLEEYAPPSVIVTADHVLFHMSSRAGRYLQMTAGEPSRDLLRLVRPELRSELRTALYQSAKQRIAVEVPNLPVSVDGVDRHVTLIVRPVLREDDSARGFFLILFADHEPTGEVHRRLRPSEPPEPIAQHLEEELGRLKVQLRTTIEQYEAQVEEAHAAAEEQQATNEELRSSAEELETSKEELQSVNEELTTVNEELKIKIDELRLSNSDFENLINSTDLATIFLDRSLRLKLTHAARAGRVQPVGIGYGAPALGHHQSAAVRPARERHAAGAGRPAASRSRGAGDRRPAGIRCVSGRTGRSTIASTVWC